MDVSRISFDRICDYWVAVDHFKDPDKRIREVVRSLGPYRCEIENPRRFSYGLFDGENLVGVTHLVEWRTDLVRYRTLNIMPACRGRDLGFYLLGAAIDLDWQDQAAQGHKLFGWIRRDHEPWATAHGFSPLDGSWHDDHIAMTRPLSSFEKNFKESRSS